MWCGGGVEKYRVNHKGWDFEDDLKLFKYENLKVKSVVNLVFKGSVREKWKGV